MSYITTCTCNNELNKSEIEEFVVCTQWDDLKMKILIIMKEKKPLVGEMLLADFNKYATTFDKTLEAYLEDTKNILSGNHEDVEFGLKDNSIFYWKRNKWALGQIKVASTTEADCLSDFTLSLIHNYSTLKKNALELEKDNENFRTNNFELSNKINEIIILKNKTETILYKKFILLLNTKKVKIREQKNKLKELENEDPIFDATTDESENESDSNKISHNEGNMINMKEKKRKYEKSKVKAVPKNRVVAEEQKTKVNELIASTGKEFNLNCNLGEDEETPDLLSGESECELELKDEEDNVDNANQIKINAIHQEDSEEEMF